MTTLLLASIFGPLLLIFGIWKLFYTSNLKKVLVAFRQSSPTLVLASYVNMLVGLFIVTVHNYWEWDYPIFVTLLGWLILLKAIVCLFVPRWLELVDGASLRTFKFCAIIPIVWGLVLCWMAFFY